MNEHRRYHLRYTSARALAAVVLMLLATSASAITLDEQAPDFTLRTLEGGNLGLDEYRGQVVLINFWASWCGPCRHELPVLDRIHRSYQAAGLVVLGINVEGTEAPARALIDKIPVSFPVLIDVDQKVSMRYQLETMPSTLLLDRHGVVRYIHGGYKPGDEAEYLEVVKQLIGE